MVGHDEHDLLLLRRVSEAVLMTLNLANPPHIPYIHQHRHEGGQDVCLYGGCGRG